VIMEKEFDNTNIHEYCDEIGIKHEVSATYTPQQNGVVERKNRTLITHARTMIDEYNTPERFWAEAINTACYASNKLFPHRLIEKTPYELLNGKKPAVTPQVLPWLEHTLVLRAMITCGRT
jgi:transposase InsO family protein